MSPRSSQLQSKPPQTGARASEAWLYAVLLLPRVVRLLYPAVWVEDDFYLESAFLVSIGMRPYLDFVHPHMPLLEWLTAGYLKLFGASHFTIEILNESAIYAANIFTYALARRATNRRAAILAALLFGFSALLFRYHVYERECFVAPVVLLAVIIAGRGDENAPRRAALVAGLFILACAVKLTAAIALLVVAALLAIQARRIRDSIIVGAGAVFGVAALSAILYGVYGFEFFFQTFLFHFMKGRLDRWALAVYPLEILDVFVPLFALGLLRLALTRHLSSMMKLVVALALAQLVFYCLLSPTAWGHNYIEVLPYLAIVAGVGLDAIIALMANLIGGQERSPTSWFWFVGGSLFVAISLTWLAPLVDENWIRGSVYGFGFLPRAELATLAQALRRASPPERDVIAPAFLSFEANRPGLIRYPETYGVYREAKAIYERDGFWAARDRMGRDHFFNLIATTSAYWSVP
ncbi:MAG: glycosyltransferase family 39 protein, partial [Candidatus Binataceae bacterium]